jgi:hypothetical protein
LEPNADVDLGEQSLAIGLLPRCSAALIRDHTLANLPVTRTGDSFIGVEIQRTTANSPSLSHDKHSSIPMTVVHLLHSAQSPTSTLHISGAEEITTLDHVVQSFHDLGVLEDARDKEIKESDGSMSEGRLRLLPFHLHALGVLEQALRGVLSRGE